MKPLASTALILLLLPQSRSSAQLLDSALAYFPLAIGNTWQYAHYIPSPPPQGYRYEYYRLVVAGDTLMPNGKTYFILQQVPLRANSLPSGTPGYLRMDSITANLYGGYYPSTPGGEFRWDSLLTQPQIPPSLGNHLTVHRDTVLGRPTLTRTVSDMFGSGYSLSWGLGPTEWIVYGEDEFLRYSILVYAKINGLEYGTLESVNIENQDLPIFFQLEQNYPNPFNPTTTIRYAIPQRIHVTLSVYNSLGQLVATLVNETKDAGYHDVRFDASGLASGVYFYRLMAGDYLATKRLLLIR